MASLIDGMSTVLVANRGEIAVRIFRTLRDLGIKSVAVYSDADRDAHYLRFADEAHHIGPSNPAESYLDIEKIVQVARACKADAVHPGYGFLAENPRFVHALGEAGIAFVGPSAEAIEAMGSKTAARQLMQQAGVPIVPGIVDACRDLEDALEHAQTIGYPIAIKAQAGGGGKAFRVALDRTELETGFAAVQGEAKRYFADDGVYLERYLADPRHVEVQVLADHSGTIVHCGERDCTIQRRHQKLVEESPSPAITPTTRERLFTIAIDAARAVQYTSAGTIEFLVDSDGEPYFLEMNTRIQVEHPITELVTGIDLIAEQLRVAAGQPLSIAQSDISFNGHALECRINAEDAAADFRPSPGTLTTYIEPAGPSVRVDSGYATGSAISPQYDNLIAKLIVWASDRPTAVQRMRRALDEYAIDGVSTLVPFFQRLLPTPQFAGAQSCRELVDDPAGTLGLTPHTPVGGRPTVQRPLGPAQIAEVNGKRFTVQLFEPHTPRPSSGRRAARSSGAGGAITAPMQGSVLSVDVADGATVDVGQRLLVIEAMKMENEILADVTGTVERVDVAVGDAVSGGQPLVTIQPA